MNLLYAVVDKIGYAVVGNKIVYTVVDSKRPWYQAKSQGPKPKVVL